MLVVENREVPTVTRNERKNYEVMDPGALRDIPKNGCGGDYRPRKETSNTTGDILRCSEKHHN